MSTITTINATDALSDSRSDINTNFSNLNTDKVEGPATSTDNAVVRYDGTGGVTLQDSSVTIDDSDVVSGVTQLNVDNLRLDGNTISNTNTNSDVVLTPNGTGVVTRASELVTNSGDSATAGGAEAIRIGTGASGVAGIYFGSGAPTVSAPKGSLYLRTDGSSTSTRLYVNTNGSTTWTNVTTAA